MIEATLIAGDGIGPEVVDATTAVLDALGSPFAWIGNSAAWRLWQPPVTRFRPRRSTASGAPGSL